MVTPLTITSRTILLPPRYGGSIGYFAALAAGERCVIDASVRYNKRQKEVHRMDICDTHGLSRLTVPVTIPTDIADRPLRWSDIPVSAHGHWWTIHLTALESAYGRTPFFQYYVDRFRPLYTPRYDHERVSVWELDRDITAICCDILGLPTPEWVVDPDAEDTYSDAIDLRRAPLPNPEVPYYQIRADRFGFMPGLSVLDLIFNMGPESPLVLKRMIFEISQFRNFCLPSKKV